MACTEFSFVLKPSTSLGVDGVGVFATHDIPAATRLFSYLQEGHYKEWVESEQGS